MIDLNPLKFLLADAQRHNREIVQLSYKDLQAMIHKIDAMQQIEECIPKKIGYCSPDEVREMCTGRGKVARVKRSPWSEFVIPIYFMGKLPTLENPVDVVAE
jgi:hypothetical protein